MIKIIKHLRKILKKEVIISCPCAHKCSQCDEFIMPNRPYLVAFRSVLERLSGHNGTIYCGVCVADLKS